MGVPICIHFSHDFPIWKEIFHWYTKKTTTERLIPKGGSRSLPPACHRVAPRWGQPGTTTSSPLPVDGNGLNLWISPENNLGFQQPGSISGTIDNGKRVVWCPINFPWKECWDPPRPHDPGRLLWPWFRNLRCVKPLNLTAAHLPTIWREVLENVGMWRTNRVVWHWPVPKWVNNQTSYQKKCGWGSLDCYKNTVFWNHVVFIAFTTTSRWFPHGTPHGFHPFCGASCWPALRWPSAGSWRSPGPKSRAPRFGSWALPAPGSVNAGSTQCH